MSKFGEKEEDTVSLSSLSEVYSEDEYIEQEYKQYEEYFEPNNS